MRFLFVDRVSAIGESHVSGSVSFHPRAPSRRQTSLGEIVIAPSVIGEAMGQLVSWAIMERQDFQFRPVYLFSERLTILAYAKPGDTVELAGTIDQLTGESVIFSGEARVGGKLIQTLSRCTNFFLPLTELEDPVEVRASYGRLRREGGDPIFDQGESYDFGQHILQSDWDPASSSLTVKCRINPDAAFYKDHFPRRPITPIVVINEIIDQAALQLMARLGIAHARPVQAARIKIKQFIGPGEEFVIQVRSDAKDLSDGAMPLTVQVFKQEKSILRGQYLYESGGSLT